tara:strand:- start:11419 stop:12045 length:627 start_codon:yes stop_codon:yes gene_type:complete
MNNRLIQLADYLDSLGLYKEANYVDSMIVSSADDEPEEGDGRVDIEPGELRDLADMMEGEGAWPDEMSLLDNMDMPAKKPGLFDNLKNVGQDIAYKIKSVMPKPIRGLLSGMGPSDPLKDHHEELREAITRYINKNYDIKGEVESVDWGWHDATDTYSYDVTVRRPWPGQDPDYIENWAVWIGPLDEDIYYGTTERVEGTNYHLAGEW